MLRLLSSFDGILTRRDSRRAAALSDHPVKVMVGYARAAGRIFRLTLHGVYATGVDLGRQFFCENRTGAGTGLLALARWSRKPDGYTILYSSNGIAPAPVYL
jgi:hypothetical protein